jgi:hypothetical protein
MNQVIYFAAREIATTMVVNTLWSAYKSYCKFCWKKFYRLDKSK